jgi:EpsI family protein
MACTAILMLEMWLLTKVGGEHDSLQEVFGLEFPAPSPEGSLVRKRRIPPSFLVSGVVLVAALLLSSAVQHRAEIVPQRLAFAEFPVDLGEWHGKSERLEQIYLNTLKLDVYILSDYVGADGKSVNFYSAYYASQSKGESAHSPRSCLPGGGWLISDLSEKVVDGVSFGKVPLKVNRVVIRRGDYVQLVYYWFQERGRIITSEYMVKWYLFWDALTKNRTDGALVRLTTLVGPDEDLSDAERRLGGFTRQLGGVLGKYIPD